MKANNVDVVLYIRSKDKAEPTAKSVAGMISQLDGVVSAKVHPKVKHLLSVKYDSDSISGFNIVCAARQTGHTALLVGM
jgi:hypothetical protein